MLSTHTILITEALRALGKERITPDVIGQLRKKYSSAIEK